MPKAPEGYQPLLNRGSRGSLWLADDHLLVIDSTRFILCVRETYRRLDFSNIQAVLHAKSQRGAWIIVLLSVILTISLLILISGGFDDRVALSFAGALAVPSLIVLIAHFIKGPTSSLIIQTSVHPWRLKMVTRHTHASKVLSALEPLCREAQQQITRTPLSTENPDTSASTPISPMPSVHAHAPPPVVGIHPLAIPAWLCLFAFAAMMGGELIWNSVPATLLMLGFATAFFILLMIAFTRGGGTLATGGRGVFIFALSTLGISLTAIYAAAMAGMLQASIRGDDSYASSEELILRGLAEFPTGSPEALSIVAMTIIALTGISAVAGLAAVLHRNRLKRMSLASPNPLSS